jgi:hypothetical protein
MKRLAAKSSALALVMIATGGAAPGSNDGLLDALNQTCLDAYRTGRQQFIVNPGPLILIGSDLTFIVNGQERHANYTPLLYTTFEWQEFTPAADRRR